MSTPAAAAAAASPTDTHLLTAFLVMCLLFLQYIAGLQAGGLGGAGPVSGGGSSGISNTDNNNNKNGPRLERTNSVSGNDSIKLCHVIHNTELVLKEVIGSGAEGKVGRDGHSLVASWTARV